MVQRDIKTGLPEIGLQKVSDSYRFFPPCFVNIQTDFKCLFFVII